MPPRVLIVHDADVRGLLACAAAAREHGSGQLVWLPPGADRQLLASCQATVRSQAELYEHALIETSGVADGAASDTERQTRLLVDAAYLAIGNRAAAVVWAGTVAFDQHQQIDLDALTTMHSRALLIERLMGIDHPTSAEFRVHLPYADLTDRQLADLVLDMDLPIWTCWWWALGRGPRGVPGAEQARVEYERWEGVLKEAGWREGIPGPATIG